MPKPASLVFLFILSLPVCAATVAAQNERTLSGTILTAQNETVARRQAARARIHGTPGYPFGLTAGITFRFFGKE
ncbi:MAG TPA: hypothetical protein VGA87_09240 [Pyrinomonadaceae bacterium]|jgi:hypothetical protein